MTHNISLGTDTQLKDAASRRLLRAEHASTLGVMKSAPLITLLALLVMTASPVAANKETMSPYQEKISNRRNSEASILWKNMQNDGFTSSSIVALDFVYFSDKKEDAERLAKVLSENYTVGINPDADSGYWLIKGSTRPYGKQLTAEQWNGWIDYMVFVGFQNNCVFSTWAVYEPKSKKTWASESIEKE